MTDTIWGNHELIEQVARAMDPLAWTEYGDRSHRELTLIHARNAIPVVIEALAREADERRMEVTFHSTQPTLADWLRSHLPVEVNS